MDSIFVIRFALILFVIMAIAAVIIHFLLDHQFMVIFWILSVPFILAIPILSAVIFTKDEELDLTTVQ